AVGLCDSEGLVSPAYVICKPKKMASPKFFFYLFKSHEGLYRLWAYSYGITGDRLRLYYQDFAKVPTALPPLPEQEKIAEILGCWDEGLESLEKLIAAKKLRKKGLMQQLLTGTRRLPGFQKSEWKEVRLGDVFKERKEPNHKHLSLLAITGSRGIIPADEVNKKDSSNEDKSKYKRICPGDLGYNTMRMWQGVSAISSREGIVSPAYTICIPGKELDAKFIGYLFKTEPVIFRFWRYSQGLVDDTLNLKFPNFAKIHITIPPLDEQKAIAAVLETADEEIRLLEAGRDALSEQKKGLMQKLLTGEVRHPKFA
ncbi:MAG TPA: restriction endonuclease subunit S, partial [Kiritimatiellia bacterium]|nr:restriction endonuclease subunit S [Kiritimatiellia bacterium]